jgi:lipase ATG15
VSFYKVTSPFVEYLKASPEYKYVVLTGHSLGGGIAMISGAQTGVQAIAVSGPNAMLSGLSFTPQVLPDQLDKYTFNVVPDNDPVPRFDDLAQNYQRIQCNAPASSIIGCHSILRTLCELQYRCGTGDRPAICECNTVFGYPKPLTIGDGEFDELCANSTEDFH